MKLHLRSEALEHYEQIFQFFTEKSWKKSSKLYLKNISQFFNGKAGENFVLSDENSVTYLIGLGSAPENYEIQKICSNFSQNYEKNFFAVPTKLILDEAEKVQLQEVVTGLYLGTYAYPFQEKHPFWDQNFSIHVEGFQVNNLEKIAQKSVAMCKGQFSCMDWLNRPANLKKTSDVSTFLKKISEEYHFKYTVFNRKECEKQGLGAFLSVNQGSAMDCAFTIIEYKSPKKNAKTVGLVGKCVLFDTGGISLKNPENMHYMKSDMGGATAVIGALICAAEMQLPVNLIAILPITDNAVSANAYLPSDVIKAYNGKTIEVLNTDAEGRMTLADGLSYLAKNYKTDALLDLATLTGSAVRMFGDTCGALFSNNEELLKKLIDSGNNTNQRLWNLPLWDVWEEDIRSDVADLKNISLKPVGDCIVAAKFLENFIENHPSWAHLDIAGVAFGNVRYAKEKAATGYGVQLLADFLEKFQ